MTPSNGRQRRREATYRRGYEDGLAAATSSCDPVAYLRHGEQTFVQNVPFGAMWISDKDDPRSFPVYDRPQLPAPSVAVKALEWIVQHPEESNASVWDVAKNALSAQVQDVARDLPSEFEKWWDDAGHYVGGVVKMTYTQRKQLAWDAFYASANPAATAKQGGDSDGR